MSQQEKLIDQPGVAIDIEKPYYEQQQQQPNYQYAYPGTAQPEECRSEKSSHSHHSTVSAHSSHHSEYNEKAGFIRKVYGIIFYMLAIVGVLAAPAMYSHGYRAWLTNNPLMMILWFFLFIGAMIGLYCQHRHVPYNYFWCTAVAASLGMIVCHVIAVTDPFIVFLAVCLTIAMTLAITLSAMATKEPNTGCLKMFMVVLITSLVSMLFMMLFAPITAFYSFLCTIYILIYGLYLWIDTWLIVNEGVHNCDTYMLAAFFVFVDIVMIFLYLLLLLGGGKK